MRYVDHANHIIASSFPCPHDVTWVVEVLGGLFAGFMNIFRTLFWFFGAMDIFENWASESRFPALMLSSTLSSG